MVTIDLTAPVVPPDQSAATDFLASLPRRLALTLPELRLAAELAGGAPLPFDVADAAAPGALEGRLGASRGTTENSAYDAAVASLHDPHDTLRRRGLLTDDGIDPGVAGAVGLLATPQIALEIDVAASGSQVKAWHRQAQTAVATLATCDGVVFELAWFAVDQWAAELARVAAVPEEVTPRRSAVPDSFTVPFQLVDAVGEAQRAGRTDLVPVLVDHHGEGTEAPAGTDVAGAVAAIHAEGQGRLRVLGAEITDAGTTQVGVVSWVLLADGWHSVTPRQDHEGPRVHLRRVEPTELASELAPVLAQVTA